LTSFELANADLKKYLGGEKKVFSFWRFWPKSLSHKIQNGLTFSMRPLERN
jgi:cephalosporin-C deacetylase-like acetyl esterase